MYAEKFVPQNPEIAASFFDHSYCIDNEIKKIEKKNRKKIEESDDDVQYNKKKVQILVYDSDSDSESAPLCKPCEYFDVSCVDTVEVCEDEIGAVQVDAVDSGISLDENIRIADTAMACEYFPGMRASSRLMYTPAECQLYLKNSTSTIGEGWKCYFAKNGCLARMHVRNGECFVANSNPHTKHDRPDQLVTNMRALNDMKSILRSVNNTLRPREIFDQVVKR